MCRSRASRIGPALALASAMAVAALAAPAGAGADDRLAAGRDASPPPVPGEVIVRYEPGLDAVARERLRERGDADLEEPLALPRTEVVAVDRHRDPAAAARDLQRLAGVAHAEPNFVMTLEAVPNDPLFGGQWGLRNLGSPGALADADVDATEAWSVATDGSAAPVAILDSGVDRGHPDLAGNVVGGRDVVAGDPDPEDPTGHGTHVAGIVGARGDNGSGVAGVQWTASLLAVRVCGADDRCSGSDLVEGIDWAVGHRARVVNASLSGPDYSETIREAIRRAPDVLFVFAAGNYGEDGTRTPRYPCSYDEPNVVCVGASTPLDALAPFSNHGSEVDLAAPGVGVYSTFPRDMGSGYASADGTSMAAPHVAGAAALVRSHRPAATAAEVRTRLLETADRPPALDGLVGAGRLNVARALEVASSVAGVPETRITRRPRGAVKERARFRFASDAAGATFECRLDGRRWRPCSSPARVRARRGRHVFRVRARGGDGAVDPDPARARFRVS